MILGAMAYLGKGLWQTIRSAYVAPGESEMPCSGGSCGCGTPSTALNEEGGGQQGGCPVIESGLDSLRETLSEVKSQQETASGAASTSIH